MFKRIIPCLDIKGGRVVKGVNFVDLKDAGDPVKCAAAYADAGADEIVMLDITAADEAGNAAIDLVKSVSSVSPVPLIVGGGIRSLKEIDILLTAGANKISINSAGVRDPELLTAAAENFGRERIIVAIDAKRYDSGWEVRISGGRTSAGLDALEWASAAEKLGAGEILLTSVDKDGTSSGYDIELTKIISSRVNIPVIASGGAGQLSHFLEVLTIGGADAALAASLFHYGGIGIRELKRYLHNESVAVLI